MIGLEQITPGETTTEYGSLSGASPSASLSFDDNYEPPDHSYKIWSTGGNEEHVYKSLSTDKADTIAEFSLTLTVEVPTASGLAGNSLSGTLYMLMRATESDGTVYSRYVGVIFRATTDDAYGSETQTLHMKFRKSALNSAPQYKAWYDSESEPASWSNFPGVDGGLNSFFDAGPYPTQVVMLLYAEAQSVVYPAGAAAFSPEVNVSWFGATTSWVETSDPYYADHTAILVGMEQVGFDHTSVLVGMEQVV